MQGRVLLTLLALLLFEANAASHSAVFSDSRQSWLITLKGHWPEQPLRNRGDLLHRKAVVAHLQQPLIRKLQQWAVPYRAYWVAPVIEAKLTWRQALQLRQRPEVLSVQRNRAFTMPLPDTKPVSASLPKGSVQGNLSQIGADQVWAAGISGAGVVVGVQDTGMDWDHELLIHRYRGWDAGTGTANHDYNWHDAIHVTNDNCTPDSTEPCCLADNSEPCDDHGHGTHVTGTILGDDPLTGNRTGVAPQAQWIGCRNMNHGAGTPSSYIECFQWFLAPTRVDGTGADPSRAPAIISNSWSCPPSEGCSADALLATVDAVQAAGILVVSAAGNSGSGCYSIDAPPAIYDSSFTIAAVDSSNQIASFSSRGPVMVDTSGRLKPDVSAPGVNIRSARRYGGVSLSSGTSMATPHVAGLAALLLQANPDLLGQPTTLRRIIRDYVTPAYSGQDCGGFVGNQRPNAVYGWGIINAWAAYQHVLEPLFTDGYED